MNNGEKAKQEFQDQLPYRVCACVTCVCIIIVAVAIIKSFVSYYTICNTVSRHQSKQSAVPVPKRIPIGRLVRISDVPKVFLGPRATSSRIDTTEKSIIVYGTARGAIGTTVYEFWSYNGHYVDIGGPKTYQISNF